MINTGRFTLHGNNQLETQAQTRDVDAFVYQGGRIVPASQVSQTAASTPVIQSAKDKNYSGWPHRAAVGADVEGRI